MNVRRGDVILVDYPFSDRTGSKVRPCLVVQADRNNRRLDDTIVVTITSRVQFAHTEPTQFLIEKDSPIGREAGLLFTSAVQCENLLTVDCKQIRRKIGNLRDEIMQHVNTCLKAALDLA